MVDFHVQFPPLSAAFCILIQLAHTVTVYRNIFQCSQILKPVSWVSMSALCGGNYREGEYAEGLCSWDVVGSYALSLKCKICGCFMFNWISARGNQDRSTKYILRLEMHKPENIEEAMAGQHTTTDHCQLINKMNTWLSLDLQGIKEPAIAASMFVVLFSCWSQGNIFTQCIIAAIWFHFSAAVITLDWILEHKMQWVPYEKLPLNWESLAIWRHVSPLVPSTSQWENLT